ncbi:hypothetical protein [Streptomyces sp. AP-93]|uniref:hypothetical protein n=1 Tax=Streptomyces sp. AP-93 TaxID=2929048 RepID=UPI001FAE90CB|nr:hypothetical protein [Streptomyces sp. AP-93]MCJ0868094.1 hypothetical protein [Streptomyces sp. AP-93]
MGPHNTPGNEKCPASGTLSSADRTRLFIAALERGEVPSLPVPVRSSFGSPLALAPWFPRWDGNAYPSIALFARRRMAYWLPETTSTDHEEKIRDLLGKRVRPRWESEYKCWTVADTHFLVLAFELLRRYPKLSIGREYNPHEKCVWRCRNAEGPLCTCSCQARNHAGGRWKDGWNILSEDTRVIDRSSWSWMAVETKTPETL